MFRLKPHPRQTVAAVVKVCRLWLGRSGVEKCRVDHKIGSKTFKFPQQEWRRLLHAARRVHEVDRIATEVNDLLASRAEWQLQNKENEYVPRAVRETLTQFDKSQRPRSKALYTNKRSRLKQSPRRGTHGITLGAKMRPIFNLSALCGLWVQQTYSQEVFQKVDAQPCRGFPSQGPRFWPTLHPSPGKRGSAPGVGSVLDLRSLRFQIKPPSFVAKIVWATN